MEKLIRNSDQRSVTLLTFSVAFTTSSDCYKVSEVKLNEKHPSSNNIRNMISDTTLVPDTQEETIETNKKQEGGETKNNFLFHGQGATNSNHNV